MQLKYIKFSLIRTQGIRSYSRNRVQRLVYDMILDSFDFTDFDVCVKCVKG